MNTVYAIMIGGAIGIIAAVTNEALLTKAAKSIHKWDQYSSIKKGAICAAILLAITVAVIYVYVMIKQKGLLP